MGHKKRKCPFGAEPNENTFNDSGSEGDVDEGQDLPHGCIGDG